MAVFFVALSWVRTRRGAELSKRVSVCQRSAQGAKAPQRPPAEQAEPLTAHHRKEKEMKTDRYGISGSTLKIIAAISMVLDHVSRIVLTNGIMTHASYNQISDEQWAILSEASDVLHVLGRIAFPLFCFLIVEGFLHTHDLKKYLRNMLVFAIIAEPIYDFVQTGQLFDLRQQNVMCELLLCLVFLIILEKIQSLSKWKRYIAETALIVLTALAAEYTKLDGGVYGIMLVAAFYLFHDGKAKMFFAAVCAVLLSSCHIVGGGFEFATANVFNPDVAAAVVSLLLINLYNGKRGLKLKYFFYIFYPAHLALLYGVSLIVLNCL